MYFQVYIYLNKGKCLKGYTWNVHYWLLQDGRIMELEIVSLNFYLSLY